MDSAKTRNTESKSGEKLAGQEFSPCSGGSARSTEVSGEGTHVIRNRDEGLQRKEESIRVVHGRDEGKAKYCCGGGH